MSDMSSAQPSSEVTSDDRLWALLSYLLTPLIPIIILLMEDKKSRPFIKAHYMQALVLGVVLIIADTVLGFILSFVLFLGCLIPLAHLALVIYYAIKANHGEYITIPVITDFVKNQGWV